MFPPPGEIPSNAVFVLQWSGGEGEKIRSLSTSDIALRREGAEVRFRVLSRGSGFKRHIVLGPAEGRLPEGPIELRIRRRYPGTTPMWTSAGSWTVSSSPDRTPPDLNWSEGTASLTRFETFGDEHIRVDFSVGTSESPVLLLASVQETKGDIPTGQREELFFFPSKHYLYRDPCGRNHALERGKQYFVDLVAVDAAGNRGESMGEVFVVDVP